MESLHQQDLPDAVLHKAYTDRAFFRQLLIARGNSAWLNHLFEKAKNSETPGQKQPYELAIRYAKSTLTWIASGAGYADEATKNRRLKACSECPHSIERPKTKTYMLGSLFIASANDKVCSLCGCYTRSKAERSSEYCPARHPENKDLTRWDEPLKT